MKVKHFIAGSAILLSIAGWGPFFLSSNNNPVGTNAWIDQSIKSIDSQASIDPKILKLALNAYTKARHQGVVNKPILTIIDYSKPSTEKRLWVIDLRSDKVLFNTWVSHGRNSGAVNATSFSNAPGSLKSSLGVFVTENTYMGGEGYSLRLNGLEQGINSNALQRNVVMHGAWYVDSDVVKRYGQLGRSWGCPAVSTRLARPIIDTIKGNTLLFAYYPDRHWLNHSTYVS